jgi:hypothetical protein
VKQEPRDENEQRGPTLEEVDRHLFRKRIGAETSQPDDVPGDDEEDRQSTKRIDRDQVR